MNPNSQAMTFTTYPDKRALSKTVITGTFDELVASMQLTSPNTHPNKDLLPAFSAAALGDARNPDGVSVRYAGNFQLMYAVVGDYDGELMSMGDAASYAKRAGIRAFFYTTASHKPDKPRWRVLAPLSYPCLPGEYAEHAERLNAVFGGVLGHESREFSRLYFYGKVEGVNYEHANVS